MVTVRCWLEELQSRSIKIGYEALNAATKQVLCTGWTKHLNIDREGRVRALPPELKELMLGGK
jgi:acyl-CoA thioesterase FadM